MTLDDDTLMHCRAAQHRSLRLAAYTSWRAPWVSLAFRPGWLATAWKARRGYRADRDKMREVAEASSRAQRARWKEHNV